MPRAVHRRKQPQAAPLPFHERQHSAVRVHSLAQPSSQDGTHCNRCLNSRVDPKRCATLQVAVSVQRCILRQVSDPPVRRSNLRYALRGYIMLEGGLQLGDLVRFTEWELSKVAQCVVAMPPNGCCCPTHLCILC